LASRHPGNVEFKLFLQEKDSERDKLKTLAEKDCFLHGVIKEAYVRGFRFMQFDEAQFWYYEIKDYEILRKHVFQAQRDVGKRTKAIGKVQVTKGGAATDLFTGLDGRGNKKHRK